MNPWKMVGPLVLVALSLVPAPAHAQRRGPSRGVSGSRPAVSRSAGSRVVVAAPYRSYSRPYYSYSRPYYSFRPRFSVGFGLYVGYPVSFPYYGYGYGYAYPYPYRYGYAYPYPYPYASYAYPYPSPAYTYPSYPPPNYPTTSAYPYPSPAPAPQQGSITVGPSSGQQNLGGISFSVTPSTAQVYVEGQYVGLVSNFSPTSQPLTLTPGRHHVEIRAVGYQMMSFDAEVTAGQVVPYQGTMER